MKIKTDTRENWINKNLILPEGEIVFEKDTKRLKIGDGKTLYTELDYLTDPGIALLYIDLLHKNTILIMSSLFSFVLMCFTWTLISMINWIADLHFVWQLYGCGAIYFIYFLILNRKLSKKNVRHE